jgi:P-type Cu+ transporter
MTIDPADAVGTHASQTYYFCSAACLERFRADPESFLRPAEGRTSPPPFPPQRRLRLVILT